MTDQPAFSGARLEAGIGPGPIIAGSTPAVAPAAMRTSRAMPRPGGFCLGHQQRAGAVIDAGRIGRVTVPSLSRAGFRLVMASMTAP